MLNINYATDHVANFLLLNYPAYYCSRLLNCDLAAVSGLYYHVSLRVCIIHDFGCN